MPAPPDLDHAPPASALATARLFWAVLLLSQVSLAALVAAVIANRPSPQAPAQLVHAMSYLTLGLLVVLLPLGYFLRAQIYKKHWRGLAVAPAGYIAGNLVLLGFCEAVALAGLLTILLHHGPWWPTIITTAIVLLVQLLNFPDGRVMQPARPRT